MYSRELERLLNSQSILENDLIEITISGKTHQGILLPRISGIPENVLTIKLQNGYNIGVKFTPGLKLKRLGTAPKLATIPKLQLKKTGLPSVSIISTGGTIGTHIDYRTGGVFMSRTAEELLSTTPELQNIINIKSLSTPFQTASEDFSVENWQTLSKEIETKINDPEVRGVIISHGTDVLHYTSAALSFMLQDLNKPVALVGAQRSPDRGSFDGALNLICSAHFVSKSDIAEVAVVMHGSTSDDFCFAHRGTKVRKMHTTRRDAFRSINDSPLAKISPHGKIEITNENHTSRDSRKTTHADAKFEKRVAMLKIYPNANPEILDFLTEKNYLGVVLEATALGHVPTGESGLHAGKFDKEMSWLPAVKNAIENGMFVAVTSQCLYGKVNNHVYRNLRLLADTGAVYCEDILPEVAYVKLGWLLAHTKTFEDTKKLMLTNLRGEINSRLTEREFLL